MVKAAAVDSMDKVLRRSLSAYWLPVRIHPWTRNPVHVGLVRSDMHVSTAVLPAPSEGFEPPTF